MKKLMFAIGLGLLSGSVWAACVGPYCFDDQGAYIGGLINDGNGSGLSVLSSATIAGLAPRAIGQEVICNTCVNGGSTNHYENCYSTSTVAPAYVLTSSSTKVCK